jgi:hypothetical protein
MSKIADLSEALHSFFNQIAERISTETGFIKRKRKLTGPSFIKALILGNLGQGNCSIEGFCQFLYEDCINYYQAGSRLQVYKVGSHFYGKHVSRIHKNI